MALNYFLISVFSYISGFLRKIEKMLDLIRNQMVGDSNPPIGFSPTIELAVFAEVWINSKSQVPSLNCRALVRPRELKKMFKSIR